MNKEVRGLLDGRLMVASTLSVTGLRIVTGLPVVLVSCCATARACVGADDAMTARSRPPRLPRTYMRSRIQEFPVFKLERTAQRCKKGAGQIKRRLRQVDPMITGDRRSLEALDRAACVSAGNVEDIGTGEGPRR